MNTATEHINIFDYVDYRSYLADFYNHKKASSNSFSLGVWAKQMDLASTASLSRVLTGVRSPGKDIVLKMSAYLKFSEVQKDYFEHLVMLDREKDDPRLAVLVMEKLKGLHPLKKFIHLDHETFSHISSWYFFVIREMVLLNDFQNDVEWIVEKLNFKVSAREVEKAIEFMLKQGLLVENDGTLAQGPDHIDWDNSMAGEASKRNHEQNLDLAKLALREIERDLREFQSVCMTISSDNIQLAKTNIREFKNKMIHLLEERQTGDATYQLQIQFFPYTKLNKSEHRNEN